MPGHGWYIVADASAWQGGVQDTWTIGWVEDQQVAQHLATLLDAEHGGEQGHVWATKSEHPHWVRWQEELHENASRVHDLQAYCRRNRLSAKVVESEGKTDGRPFPKWVFIRASFEKYERALLNEVTARAVPLAAFYERWAEERFERHDTWVAFRPVDHPTHSTTQQFRASSTGPLAAELA